MESKKNRQEKTRKATDQVKTEPRQKSQAPNPKPNQTNATDERPCY